VAPFLAYRTRWQAWDYPSGSGKRFIDLHADSVNGGLLLPLHLGWWNFQHFNPPQVEPTYPDVIEYLGAKLIGWDAGISLTGGIDQARLAAVPLFGRAVDILRTCEELRRANAFDERSKPLPGRVLSGSRRAKWRFRPAVRESPWLPLQTLGLPGRSTILSRQRVRPRPRQPQARMTIKQHHPADLSEPGQFASRRVRRGSPIAIRARMELGRQVYSRRPIPARFRATRRGPGWTASSNPAST
jgi:hypothetical protein